MLTLSDQPSTRLSRLMGWCWQEITYLDIVIVVSHALLRRSSPQYVENSFVFNVLSCPCALMIRANLWCRHC